MLIHPSVSRFALFSAAGFAIVAASAVPARAASFAYTNLDAPGYNLTSIAALNDSDEVAGAVLAHSAFQGFVWSAGTFAFVPQTIGFIAVDAAGIAAGQNAAHPYNSKTYLTYDIATGVTASVAVRNEGLEYLLSGNGTGQLIGQTQHKSNRPVSGIRITGANSTYLNYPGAADTLPQGIGPTGLVAGAYNDQSALQIFTYNGRKYTSYPLPAGNNGALQQGFAVSTNGTVGGTFGSGANSSSGFLLKNGIYTIVSYPGAVSTSVTGIGPRNEAVGTYTDNAGLLHGMIYRKGKYYSIDYPAPNGGTNINGVNAKGTLHGSYLGVPPDASLHAFIAQCAGPVACTH